MFGDDPTFSNIRELYDICKEQGYEFPKSKSQESNYIVGYFSFRIKTISSDNYLVSSFY